MKMPITYGEWLDMQKSKKKENDRILPGTGGKWVLDDDCNIYAIQITIPDSWIENALLTDPTLDRMQTIRVLALSRMTDPIFPHVWWKDEISIDYQSRFNYFTRSWFDEGKAKFIPEDEK